MNSLNSINGVATNSITYGSSSVYTQKYNCTMAPEPQIKNLSYIDSRCLAMLSPSTLLEMLSRQISNPKNLSQVVEKHPELKEILSKHNLKVINGDLLTYLRFTDEHMRLCANIASRVCDKMKTPVNKLRVVQAARLHDLGKLFMPPEIINKPGNLTEKEKEIMDYHAELSYHLLKVLNYDEKTLQLIKNHHNYKNSSFEQQIVSASDIYAALIENRPYKKPMPPKQALSIIEQSGFSKEVVNALKEI